MFHEDFSQEDADGGNDDDCKVDFFCQNSRNISKISFSG